jgi:putative polyhydroxyalkanoate system protein
MRWPDWAALPADERRRCPASRTVNQGDTAMPDIHIHREHTLGLPEARKVAFEWAEMAEEKFDMECTYEEGKTEDLVTFTRSGVNGELKVTKDRFELDARLGFLLGAFKDRIEGEIVKNLDTLLAARTSAGSKAPAKKAAAKKKA